MIDEEFKYFSFSGDVALPGGPSTWHITDWDQRRVVSVTMDWEQDDESIAIEHFRRFSDQLSPDIYEIRISDDGEIISTSTDAEDDMNYCVHYPSLRDLSLPEGVQTVRRDELEELERLGPDVDLVVCPPGGGAAAKKVVFKYYFHYQNARKSWKETNLCMHLPRHPNLVPFHRVVVDELEGRVVGFSNVYVSGGTLEENPSRVFKLKWLQQLIQLVDDLNLRYGIAHQDIAPRNLLVDEPTDAVMLFDFNFAARINCPSPGREEGYREDRNDIKGVIFTAYEIITRDTSLRNKDHGEQSLDDLEKEWVKHPEVQLDHPVAEYRLLLREWRQRRVAGGLDAAPPGGLPDAINWPERPMPPEMQVPALDANRQPTYIPMDGWMERRQEVRDRGGKVLNWERPPQSLVDKGIRLLSSGEVIKC